MTIGQEDIAYLLHSGEVKEVIALLSVDKVFRLPNGAVIPEILRLRKIFGIRRCRCGVLETADSEGCEWHPANTAAGSSVGCEFGCARIGVYCPRCSANRASIAYPLSHDAASINLLADNPPTSTALAARSDDEEAAARNATEEWPSLDAVPADVRKVRDREGDEYRRRKNGGWKFRSRGPRHWTKLCVPAADYDNYAPFAAGGKGKA